MLSRQTATIADEPQALCARLAEAEDTLQRDPAGRNRRAGRGGCRRQPGLHARERRRAVPHARRADAGRRRGSDERGDILYANARFAALAGEPLESVVGSRLDRFLHAVGQKRIRGLLAPGSGWRRSRLVPARIAGRRRAPVARDHDVERRRSAESGRDRSHGLHRGAQRSRARGARKPHERRVSDAASRTSCALRSARSPIPPERSSAPARGGEPPTRAARNHRTTSPARLAAGRRLARRRARGGRKSPPRSTGRSI